MSCAAALVGLADSSTDTASSGNSSVSSQPTLHQTDHPHLQNLLQVTDNIYSGSAPTSQHAFARLEKLGIKTVVSVDGCKPNLNAARKHGLRYVHIPIGYDGVEAHAGKSLARLVREANAPYYVHCHHGRHRGPAAAAVAGIAAGELNHQQARRFLRHAGTSQDYAGLWRAVENYQPPAAEESLPQLVAVAQVGSLATAMTNIDRTFHNLQLCRRADWATPQNHPDLAPAQQALLLRQSLRETLRNLTEDRAEPFQRLLKDARDHARDIETNLRAGNRAKATQHLKSLEATCIQCHRRYRN